MYASRACLTRRAGTGHAELDSRKQKPSQKKKDTENGTMMQ